MYVFVVNCRVGSLEKKIVSKEKKDIVNCRVGSLENHTWRRI